MAFLRISLQEKESSLHHASAILSWGCFNNFDFFFLSFGSWGSGIRFWIDVKVHTGSQPWICYRSIFSFVCLSFCIITKIYISVWLCFSILLRFQPHAFVQVVYLSLEILNPNIWGGGKRGNKSDFKSASLVISQMPATPRVKVKWIALYNYRFQYGLKWGNWMSKPLTNASNNTALYTKDLSATDAKKSNQNLSSSPFLLNLTIRNLSLNVALATKEKKLLVSA